MENVKWKFNIILNFKFLIINSLGCYTAPKSANA